MRVTKLYFVAAITVDGTDGRTNGRTEGKPDVGNAVREGGKVSHSEEREAAFHAAPVPAVAAGATASVLMRGWAKRVLPPGCLRAVH